MKVAVVTAGGIPNPAQSGSSLTVWTVVRHLLTAGHDVSVVLLRNDHADDPGATTQERIAALEALGAETRLVGSSAQDVEFAADPTTRLRRLWRPPDEELLPQLADGEAVAQAVDELAPDVAYVYHWEALAATRPLRGRVPRFATVVDLPQLSWLYRWRAGIGGFERRVAQLPWLQARLRNMPRLMVELLNECEASGNFAAHHAAWLRRHGAKDCAYYRTPIYDLAGEGWQAGRDAHARGETARVLLIGHLRGISTLDGLDVFAERTLPRLEERLGGRLEVRLAGGYDPPPELRKALDRPSVRFLGHVEDAADEFASASLLLVPTSIPLGTRVRILSAFSFGCPVVAHTSNAAGIPELADEENVLLGRSADELADGVVRVASDRDLARRLETGGRRAYERFFAPPVAAARVEATLREISGSRPGATRRSAVAPAPTPAPR